MILSQGKFFFFFFQIPIVQNVSVACAIAASNRFFFCFYGKVESVPLLEGSFFMTYLQNEEWTGEGASAGILHNTVITNLYDK